MSLAELYLPAATEKILVNHGFDLPKLCHCDNDDLRQIRLGKRSIQYIYDRLTETGLNHNLKTYLK
jgi:hypothetical protein